MRKLHVDEHVFEIAPEYVRIVVQARGNSSAPELHILDHAFRAACDDAAARFGHVEDLASIEPAKGWREAFRSAGWSGSKFRSSVEALLRRASRGELGQLGSPLVDAGTVATLRHLVPIGVHIVDDLPAGDLVLGPATGDESFVPFEGPIERPEAGEIVYKCGEHVLTRRWVWRQGRLGSIDGSPTMLAVNVDILHPEMIDETAALATVTEMLNACGATVMSIHRLDSKSNTSVLSEW